MSLADIKALDVGGMLAPDAMLYLWVPTVPAGRPRRDGGLGLQVQHEHGLGEAGPRPGVPGPGQHETLLVGMHGSIPKPAPDDMPASVYRSEKQERKHSRKPPYYHELLDELYPGLAKIELFAREPRKGWIAWGNEGVGQ